ncbi:TolC family protein [Xanthomonas hortorum]|uniref:TolC family protein n=1 Tax=Xanthomonas hortorum pv. hederae TaxID=453603 RepID=A0A9X4HA04_9XANT|nr:TolC family protein [Xanthomonas hortorum]MDC8640483.1 TolC family protein [Xanthomonas hortorum pv. hederae]
MYMLLGRPLTAVGLAVAVLVCASPSMASPPAQAAPSYESLIAGLEQMPTAIEAQALSDAADARTQQARALPNPSIGLEAENIYGTGPYTGLGNADATVSISQPLELFGQRRARIDAARSEADAVGLRSEQMRWQAAGRLALAYAEAEAASRRHDLAAEALSLAEQDARAVALLVKEGREATLRGIQADSEAEAARAALDEARAMRDAAFARLSAIAMLDEPVQAIKDSLLDRTPTVPPADADVPLAVRIAQAEYETASRRITVERRRARPDISATVGSRRFRETGDDAFTVGLNLSIPLFDRNRGGISAAYADQRAAEARLVAEEQEVKAERLGAEATLTASNMRTRAADSGVAAAEEAYRLARIGFDAGRISLLELRSTRAALIASRATAVDARIARVLAEIDLAGLEGRIPFGEAR